LRKDAKLRREALIAAAAELFLERGFTVALEEIAARAGVGRGTLYRNFADRETLAIAVFEQSLASIEEIVARERIGLREAMSALVHTGATSRAVYARIAEELMKDGPSKRLRALRERFATALAPLVTQAKRNGELRADATVHDILLILRMLAGLQPVLRLSTEGEGQVQSALDIIFRGLSPS
jgi:AcrR family transcriptional regulator